MLPASLPACREVHTCSCGYECRNQAGVGRRAACGMRAARIQGAEGFLVDMIVTCASTQTNFSSLDEARASSWTPLLKLGWHPSGKVVIKVAER